MHPELFTIGDFTVHTYGFMIMLGATLGYFYMSTVVKKELGIPAEKIQNLAILIIVAAFVGGKVFFYFEDPGYYFGTPANMFKGFRTGFVFYGSLLFAIPTVIWYFRKNKWPVLPMLDRIAIAGCIIHVCGRLGCFFAGCCHGLPTESFLGVTFTDPVSQAEPLNTPLHPTQLYEVTWILIIMITLIMFKRHKRFEGQLFFIYIIMYSVGRSIIEIFRGDVRRGFIIDGILSHSQAISLVIIAGTIITMVWLKRKQKLN
ncbi:prolipoprotein diacylglyceryl transferase [Marinoscillum sp.]|uniref:prolipoprotein diacylglyceryl transferase n=1 Tax=Marinoscillum sp. TaxID=2024838 RepID=UPI003BAAB0DB